MVTILTPTEIEQCHINERGGKSGGEREITWHPSLCGAVVESWRHDQEVQGSNPNPIVKVLFFQFSFDLTKYIG
jgi:hypothetical protein